MAQLLRESIGSIRSYEVEGTESNWAGKSLRKIGGIIYLIRTKQGILIKADIQAEIVENCIRCLKQAICPIHFIIEDEVFPRSSFSRVDSTEQGNEFYIIDNDHNLDMGEILRQYIEINKPLKPLCHIDCNGNGYIQN